MRRPIITAISVCRIQNFEKIQEGEGISMTIEQAKEKAEQIKKSIGRVIVGKERVTELLLTAVIAGGHVLLEDVPGTGKTMLAKSLSRSVGVKFARIQFTPDLLPSDITGLNYYNQKEGEFVFREGPVFANILLADEINRATPRTQSSLLECMEEKQITVDGKTYALEAPFFVVATQNPIETAGTFPLPEAQMDRFLMQISMDLPSMDEEIAIIDRFIKENPLETVEPVITGEELVGLMESCREVTVHPSLKRYIVQIIEATRDKSKASMGVSPRGTLALVRALQAYAMIHGRSYVVPEDVKELAVPVLAHRIVMQGTGQDREAAADWIKRILASVEVPSEDWK